MYCQLFNTSEIMLICAFLLFAFVDDIDDLSKYIVNRIKKHFIRNHYIEMN